MVKAVCIDTGYIIALESADDQHHDEALKHWQSLALSLPSPIATSYIFHEVVTFFHSRDRHSQTVEIGSCRLRSPSVQFNTSK